MKIRFAAPPPLPTVSPKKRACTYDRITSQEEEHIGKARIEGAYLALQQQHDTLTFTHLFIEGKSIEGKSAKPIQFYEMLALADQGKWEVILFPSLAGLAPNKSQLLPLLNALNTLSLEVHFLQEQLVLSSPEGQRLLAILTTLNDGERERARKQITTSIRERFQQGESWLNTTRFLGYIRNKHGELEIQPQEAVIVRRIFKAYLEGLGSTSIAKQLNNEGIPTVTGSIWRDSTILYMLKNEKYKGAALLQKTWTNGTQKQPNRGECDAYYLEDHHPAIIAEEDWQAVQLMIRKRKHARPVPKAKATRSRLAGQLRCGLCGETLIRRQWKRKTIARMVVWQCRRYVKWGKTHCRGTFIREAEAEQVTLPYTAKEVITRGKTDYRHTRTCPTTANRSVTREKTHRRILSRIH